MTTFKVTSHSAIGGAYHTERTFEADYHKVENGVLTLRKYGSSFPLLVACFAAGTWVMVEDASLPKT